MTRRAAILIAALLATLAATWWAASLEEAAAPVEPAAQAVDAGTARTPTPRRPARAPIAGAPAADAPTGDVPTESVPATGRARWPDAAVGLFQPFSFQPAPAAPPPLAAPAADAVPPLPFRFVGALEDRGQRAVILLEADTVHVLRTGERVDARYRVERITPTEVVFTYLPARQRQTLDLSAHDPSH
jgi:HAMP domain-containing protein